ncbi:MAG: hypothetical protein U1D55_14290 [Phycisphaerae bacterium]
MTINHQINGEHPLRRLFRGLIEQVFHVDLGLCDPAVTEYLTELMVDFVHIDRIYRLHDASGDTIRELSRMEADAQLGASIDGSLRTRLINRYIGDFTLFWVGVYPEGLRVCPRAGSRLTEYMLVGKRSYGIASELSDNQASPSGALLKQLSQEFECCVHGLNRVRECWRKAG